MEIHKVKCDKCGKEEEMKEEYVYHSFKLPFGWRNVQKNWAVDVDLCHKCFKKFERNTRKFLQDASN